MVRGHWSLVMKRILFVSPGWEQEPLLKRLSDRQNFKIFAVRSSNTQMNDEHVFTDILYSSLFDIRSIIDFAITNQIEAVISDQCDYSLYAQAAVSHGLNLPGMSMEAAYLSNNKYLQRQKSNSMGIKIPEFKLCCGVKDVMLFAENIGYPIILKPTDNRGSIGVVKVSSADEIDSAFITAISSSRSQLILAEEFIDGIQFTVDGYVQPNEMPISLAVGEKIMLSEKVQVAMGISYPSSLKDNDYNELLTLNGNVNHKLGYNFGMTHSEYMLRDGEYYLIESSNRGGGCFTSEIVVPEVTQIDLLGCFISDCFGINSGLTELAEIIKKVPVTLQFFSLPNGKFKGIKNWEELIDSDKCILGRINISEGEYVEDITNDGNRHGFFIVNGDSKCAKELIDSMEFGK